MISICIARWRMTLVSVVSLAAILALTAPSFELNPISRARAQEQRECNVRVTLLQVNDVYQFAPVDGGTRGGLARVLTLRKEIMSESPHALYLLAGDTISPSVESNTYQGKQM